MMSIHPFPARMAPELAISRLDTLPKEFTILDPMSGSGTVVRHASELGLKARGFDLDPLAVLVSRVASRQNDDQQIEAHGTALLDRVAELTKPPPLCWIDGDPAAEKFIEFWFAAKQRKDLRKLAFCLSTAEEFGVPEYVANVLRVALSRIIVTKKQTASLAQDTSHSRPHRVTTESDYDVIDGFAKSLKQLRKRLVMLDPIVEATVEYGDARELSQVDDESIDYVLTSPPYLNAIDYMRGHRLSLIWLGHKYADLALTRSNSIGSERRPDKPLSPQFLNVATSKMGELDKLSKRHVNTIERYLGDLHKMMEQIHRVLKDGSKATFVMGDSCLQGVLVSNSNGLASVAQLVGLKEIDRIERALPPQSRYLPTPDDGALGKRMRKETILTFEK